ncbi:hypothetical protein FQR65_LT17988 [Abscondita terminalis]|nr:hypothetical protein FQR65_LT17988 [Abscondita terminalis]
MKFDAKGAGIEKADKRTIYILLTLSILVVILSAINFINLTTAQASQRAKEVGVRKAVGKVFRQWYLSGFKPINYWKETSPTLTCELLRNWDFDIAIGNSSLVSHGSLHIYAQDEKSYEQWNPNKDNVYLVETYTSDFGTMVVSSYPELFVSKEKFNEIEDFSIANSWNNYKLRLISGERSAYASNARVSDSFFDFFPFEKIAGSYKNAVNSDGKMAISEETAKALFGEEYKDCIGKTVKMDDAENKIYIVTAVYKLPKENTVFRPGFVMKHTNLLKENEYDKQWTNYSYVKYMMNKDLGFKGDQIVQIEFNKTDWRNNYNYKKYLRLKNEVLKIPGVVDITSSIFKIGEGMMNTSSVKNAADTTKTVNDVGVGGVDHNYFDVYKLQILSGRTLDSKLASDTISGVIANETFIKKMGWNKEQALDKEVLPGWEDKNKKYKILGLSMGLTIFLLVFLNWQDEKSYEKWVPNKENIYFVELQTAKNNYASNVNYPLLHTAPKMFPEIENYSVVNIWEDDKTKLIADGRSVYTIPHCNNILPALSEDTAKALFVMIIGQYRKGCSGQIMMGELKYVVQAIYKNPADAENTIFRGGFIVRQSNIDNNQNWTNYSFYGFFRVKPNTNIAKLEEKLSKWDDDNERADRSKYGWADDRNPIHQVSSD